MSARINPALAAEAAAWREMKARQKKPVLAVMWRTPVQPVPEKPPLLPMADLRAARVPYRIGAGIPGSEDDSGIYFLFDGAELVYIGLSVYVSARLRSHFMKRLDDPHNAMWFDHYAATPVPQIWLRDVEYKYIRRERPPLNVSRNHD